MNVLIACEWSGAVRDAFIRKGHNAWSCDTEPGEGYYSNRHIQDDVERVLGFHSIPPGWFYRLPNLLIIFPDNYWDMLIAFPPCTYLCSSGLHWNKRDPARTEKTEDALAFVRRLMNAPIHRICIENPAGCIGTRIRPATQYIQPHEYGHDASKRTGLWLKNLEPLKPTKYIEPRYIDGKPRWANQLDSGQNRLGPSKDRAKIRGKTYTGIANAMADQWG